MSEHQKGGSSVVKGEKMFGRLVGDDVKEGGVQIPEDSGFYSGEMEVIKGFGTKM